MVIVVAILSDVCFSMGYLVKFPFAEIWTGIGASSEVLVRCAIQCCSRMFCSLIMLCRYSINVLSRINWIFSVWNYGVVAPSVCVLESLSIVDFENIETNFRSIFNVWLRRDNWNWSRCELVFDFNFFRCIFWNWIIWNIAIEIVILI